MSLIPIIIFIAGSFFGAGMFWFFKNSQNNFDRESRNNLKAEFGDLSKQALDQNLDSFLKLAENKFSELLKTSDSQLNQKKELIDQSIIDMKTKLEGLNKSTNELKGHVENSQKGIGDLAETTNKLSRILSSSQERGQWGERMVEDILGFMGLVEGINFEKQLQAGDGRPDFTFKLPNNKMINMDVKFPLVHYENFLSSDNENEKLNEKNAFLRDVRNHVKAIEKRSYINPAEGTVDYVLMFIPNESVYAFLNQEDKDLIDFSLSRKVLLCSPITLYAVLSLIRQAVSNFAMEQKAGEMQELVGVFRKQWEQFSEKIYAMGRSITALTNHYDDLKGPRFRALEKPMEKINELQLGQESKNKKVGRLKKILITVLGCALVSCVGPADPDHGLVENLPVVINKNDVFALSLRADNFNYDETFPLSISIPSNKKTLSTLIVTDFSSNDSSIIQILGVDDSMIVSYLINSNKTLSVSSNYTTPKKAFISLNSFSGIIDWVVTATSE